MTTAAAAHRRDRPGRRRWLMAGALAAASLLAGCNDEKKAAPAKAAAPSTEALVQAVEQDLRSAPGMPAQPRFRGLQVWPQAAPQRVAVCGQVTPFANDASIFVPFVSVMTVSGAPGAQRVAFDRWIGSSTSEATRVYSVMVADCFDGGGQASGVPSIPPLPSGLADPASPPPQAAPQAQPAPDPTQQKGTIAMRQAATMRAEPHGAALRTVQRGTVLKLFSQAPGGWLQVGVTAPEGWVHESMVDRR